MNPQRLLRGGVKRKKTMDETTNNRNFKKTFAVLVLISIISLFIFNYVRAYHIATPFISGSNFNAEFSSGESLAFDSDATLLIKVKSGFLNCSSCNLKVYNDQGTFKFHVQNGSGYTFFTKKIFVSEDAPIYEDSPNSNYGQNAYDFAKNYTGATWVSYLKFSLSQIPNDAEIISAKVFLRCDAIYGTSHISNIRSCSNDSWTEDSITWNNAPSYDQIENSLTINKNIWYGWSVTSNINQEFGDDKTATFVFQTNEVNEGADFRSKDYAVSGNCPYLEVNYKIPFEFDYAILEVSSPDAAGGFDILISGANLTSNLGNFTYQATVKTGNSVTIWWGWRIESWVDKYTLVALGLAGLVMMVFSPTWVALTIRKKGVGTEAIEKFGYGLLLFCMGFALFIMWLWS